MSHRTMLAMGRPCGLLCVFIFILACSRLATDKPASSDLKLTLTLDKATYLPGEPVIATVTLANAGGGPRAIAQLDHGSVAFTFQPQKQSAASDLRFVEPIYSTKEQTGLTQSLAPQGAEGSSLTRQFCFTTLSFERGGFVLGAVYTRASEPSLKRTQKTYAKGAAFTVQGAKPYAHRYLNGLISREDAVNLATAQSGGKSKAAETLLITDEAGFYKWWVNLIQADGSVKSWFVDPYFTKAWKEARPFTAADKGVDPTLPPDSTVLKRLREQNAQRKTR